MATVKLTKNNFKKTIEANNFVIVDFWAPWCEPCVKFTPVFEAASEKNKDITFGMVDIEADPEIGEYFQVDKIPGLLIIREQAGIHTQIGQIGASALMKSSSGRESTTCHPLEIITKEKPKAKLRLPEKSSRIN